LGNAEAQLELAGALASAEHSGDKRQFFTAKSPNNKGRNAVNNALKRNFPTLMFHQ